MILIRKILGSLTAAMTLAACQTNAPVALTDLPLRHALVNGADLPYIEQGSGIPVVFVHGSMTDYRIWEAERPAIAAQYRYIAYTQRFFGAQPTQGDGKPFAQATHAADLIAFIQYLHAGPVHVVAWSYGGSVATLAATQHPELFRTLSLHEPTIGSLIAGTPEGKAAIGDFGKQVGALRAIANSGDAHNAAKQFWEFVVRLPAGGFSQEPHSIQRIVMDNISSVPLTLNAPPQPISCDSLKSISAPVLITVGVNTRPLWALSAAAMQRCVPHGKLIDIADSNHDAIIRNPAAFNRALSGFLARH